VKTLQDFPEFRSASENLRAAEDELRSGEERKGAIQAEANKASPAGRVAFHQGWREEYEQLERREPLLLEQIETAKHELARVRGQCNLEICRQERPKFVEQIRRVLQGLEQVCDANDELNALRSELERHGIETGSIPHAIFAMDRWDDIYGGKVVGYRRWIAENFPELKTEVE
jgi:hypothetical protein